jgi:hypothetical protein
VEPIIQVIPGDCPNRFTETRTWTFVDSCGNTSSVSQTINVIDTLAPVAPTPPADTLVACAADVPAPVDLTAVDNCDGDITVSPTIDVTPGACANQYVELRTWTFVDGCGNTSSVSQIVTVHDDVAPVITCPPDAVFSCDQVGDAGTATATDNCDANPVIEFRDDTVSAACPLQIVRTWVARDACDNESSCQQNITVNDNTPPDLSDYPQDQVVECDNVPPMATLTASDNCDPEVPVDTSETRTDGSCFCSYTLTLTWTAVDGCGNRRVHTQVITVEDRTPPVLFGCLEPDTVACDSVWSFTPPEVSDNCDPSPELGIASIDTVLGPQTGDTTFTAHWQAIDSCGNMSVTCAQTIVQKACPGGPGCSYTMGGWGSKCPDSQADDMESTQPGCIRDHYFDLVFPDGVYIGDTLAHFARWTTAYAVQEFLPAGGPAGPLTAQQIDPTTTSANVLGGQLLALKLNAAYSCAGVMYTLGLIDEGYCYGAYLVPEHCGGPFAGMTVNNFLDVADRIIGGDTALLSAYQATYQDINEAATCMNELWDACDPYAPRVSLQEMREQGLILGDVNNDKSVGASDIVYLIRYVYKAGPPPEPYTQLGDFLYDYKIGSSDIIDLVRKVFQDPSTTR